MRKPLLTTVVNEYVDSVINAMNVYVNAEKLLNKKFFESINGYEVFSPKEAKNIISMAFFQVVVKWEILIENIFIRYVAGAKSPSGKSPKLLLNSAKNLEHSYKIISGKHNFKPENDHINFGDWNKTCEAAKVFFEKGEPFTSLTKEEINCLKEIKIIRNRIAHSSKKCKNQFKKLAIEKGIMRRGLTAGDFLVYKKEFKRQLFTEKVPKTYFTYYLDTMAGIRGKLIFD